MKKKSSKKSRKDKQSLFRRLLPFFIVFIVLASLEAGYFLLRYGLLSERMPFGLNIAGADLSLMQTEAAEAELAIIEETFLDHPIVFEFEGEEFALLPREIDLDIAIEKKLGLLQEEIIHFGEVAFDVSLNEKRLRRALLAAFPELEYSATDAKVFLNDAGELEILQEKNGHSTDFDTIESILKKNIGLLSEQTISIRNETIEPKIFAATLEPFREELEKIVTHKLVLKETEYERFEIDLAERIAWFDFQENDDELEVFFREDKIATFVDAELGPLVNEMPHDVIISKNTDDKIVFEGVAKSGKAVDKEQFFEKISQVLTTDEYEMEIPFEFLPAPVKASTEIANLGIQDLIGEAITNYDGSPNNRQHNIQVAADKLNGMLVEDGDEFSFLQRLGYINTRNGYKHELVIIEGDVTPEVGGGVCQVSTTFFRTALDAGLPITRHKPHSLKVAYYHPPGLDAAIYPGQADMRFINDTGKPLLIQTAVEGTQIRVNFFGTHDGRSVKLAGPFYPNGEAITDLRYAGMKMFWTREIHKDEEEAIEERYNATYQFAPRKN